MLGSASPDQQVYTMADGGDLVAFASGALAVCPKWTKKQPNRTAKNLANKNKRAKVWFLFQSGMIETIDMYLDTHLSTEPMSFRGWFFKVPFVEIQYIC